MSGSPAAEPCPNCGDPTPGQYCPSCGQRRGERRVTLRRMVAEIIEDQFSLNATLPRTLKALLFRPGFLSGEYIDGRIQRYIPPFRLYLATSVVFFLLLSFQADGTSRFVKFEGLSPADSARSVRELVERIDSTRATAEERERALRPFRTGWTRLDSMGNEKVSELLELPPAEAGRTITRGMLQRAPTAMFLVLPAFALLLQLLYFRTRRYYVEHFVFALHTHAFAFVLFTVMLLAAELPVIAVLLQLWALVYGYLALRRYYGQGRLLTLLKFAALGLLYGVVVTAGLALTLFVNLLLS